MKDSEVYLKAAKLIDSGECDRSCWAVELAQGLSEIGKSQARRRYVDEILGTEWTCCLFDDVDPDDENRIRVLALLFMHQIALDEES